MLNPGGMAKDDLSNFLWIKTSIFKKKKQKTVASEIETEVSPSQKSENVGGYSDLTEGETGFQQSTIPEDSSVT